MRLWTPIIRAKFPSIHYTSPFKGDDIEGRLFQVNDNRKTDEVPPNGKVRSLLEF